jgi:hypothetical protein
MPRLEPVTNAFLFFNNILTPKKSAASMGRQGRLPGEKGRAGSVSGTSQQKPHSPGPFSPLTALIATPQWRLAVYSLSHISNATPTL